MTCFNFSLLLANLFYKGSSPNLSLSLISVLIIDRSINQCSDNQDSGISFS